MEEMFKKGQGFMNSTTGDIIPANDRKRIEYIFEEVGEPFEWKPGELNAEEQLKRLNDQIQKNGGVLYLNDPLREIQPASTDGVRTVIPNKIYLVNVHTDNGERYPEDYNDYDFVLKAFSSKESANAYFSRHEEVAKDTANFLNDNDACYTDDDWTPDDTSFKVKDFNNDVLTLYVNTPCEFCVFTYSIKEMEVFD